MHHDAKCPKCEAPVSTVKFEVADISEHSQNVTQVGLYLCPSCNTVLGAGLHPEILVSNIVERLKQS